MRRQPLNSKGLGLIPVLIAVVVLVVLGGAGVYVYHRAHKTKASTNASSNTTNTSLSQSKSQTSNNSKATTTTPDPYAGWKTYRSKLGGFSFKYPANGWTFDGFQGYTPVSGSSMNGSETQIRLFETSSTYSIIMNIGTINQVGLSDTYSSGSVSTLGNGVQAWQTNASAVTNSQCFSGTPIDLALVSGGNFYMHLSNGQYLGSRPRPLVSSNS